MKVHLLVLNYNGRDLMEKFLLSVVKAALLFLGLLFIASIAAFIRMYRRYARADRP